MKIKLALYERHGVKEYGIVHPIDNIVMVFQLDKNKKYSKPTVYSEADKITTLILKGLEIDLGLVFKK